VATIRANLEGFKLCISTSPGTGFRDGLL